MVINNTKKNLRKYKILYFKKGIEYFDKTIELFNVQIKRHKKDMELTDLIIRRTQLELIELGMKARGEGK